MLPKNGNEDDLIKTQRVPYRIHFVDERWIVWSFSSAGSRPFRLGFELSA
jgi:hypothetical protein